MSIPKRTGKTLLHIAALFVLLEPIWMLTPFVGFLYGSVLNIEVLESGRATSWLLLFVFPTKRLLPVGLFLTLSGISVCIIGAFQVYSAKVLRKGFVKTGIYRYLRHPQYSALIVAGVGFVLMWGRFMAYLCLFVMTYLYYLLSKKEEQRCLARFGKAYREHSKQTIGVIPGMDFLEKTIKQTILSRLPKALVPVVGFLLVTGLALGSGFTILKARQHVHTKLPVIQKEISIDGQKLRIVTFRMCHFEEKKKGFDVKFWVKHIPADDIFLTLTSSKSVRDSLRPFFQEGMDTLFLIFEPRRSIVKRGEKVFVNVLMVPMNARPELAKEDFEAFRKSWEIKGLVKINEMVLGEDAEPVKGNIEVFAIEDVEQDRALKNRIEAKLSIQLSQFF